MSREKVRLYALARELNMESKDLLDLCKQAGFDLKNQLSSLDPEQKDLIVQMIKRGGGGTATATAPPPASTPVLPAFAKKTVRNLTPPPRVKPPEPTRPVSAPPVSVPRPEVAPPSAPAALSPAPAEPEPPAAPAARPPEPAAPEKPTAPARPAAVIAPTVPPSRPAPVETPVAAQHAADGNRPPAPPPASEPSVPPTTYPGNSPTEKRIRDLGGSRAPREMKARPQPRLAQPRPMNIPLATPPKSPIVNREPRKAPENKTQTPIGRFTKEMLDKSRKEVIRPEDVLEPKKKAALVVEEEDESERDRKKKAGIGDRKQRKQAREERAKERRLQGQMLLDPTLDEADRVRIGHRHKKKVVAPITQPRQRKVTLETPISVRALSEAIGLKAVQLLFKLREHGLASATINSSVEPEVAEVLALEAGIELEIKGSMDAEDDLIDSLSTPDKPEDLVPRPPVVTVMGHVDHGKTSLLDRIRRSNVAATEAGGITQVIRAWRVEHDGKSITFLDTPGHEAFTKMRARGAQVTDIAVIVVAADDGVMPQTQEAINHAKAAGVSLVVAINKVDLPNANVERTKQQLYGLDVLPDNMGGDTPFVETSASTGKGIDELLESILIVAELKDLKANPNRRARGMCLEAMLSEGEGVQATLLVQNGTLHRGDVVLCGASYGRIRQMYDDHGKPLEEAGPSLPVRITGLDHVPNADDPFYAVGDLATAREIAVSRKDRQREAGQAPRTPMDLSRLGQHPIQKLNVILKADFRGSIEAIRKELEKFKHDEVEVNILQAMIGGISESDVQLALTSPENTMIVGFNVVPDDRARALAEDRGIPVREYNVIYELTNDVRAALEGKLRPRQEVIHLGRAVVRETFKVSRVGTIAGCYVTQGVIRRSAKVRLIRDGVVIFPPADKSVGLDSLKRFKDDASEVREGFECGLKIAGYDDVKVGDVVEAYRIEEVQRKLDQP